LAIIGSVAVFGRDFILEGFISFTWCHHHPSRMGLSNSADTKWKNEMKVDDI
jgi:hypothetical protein